MGSAPQPPTTQRIRNALAQRLSNAQEIAPDEIQTVYASVLERVRGANEPQSPEEMCAAAHRSGEMFEGGYRGDGQ